MKTSIVYLIIGLLLINSLKAQVKIGNNPQNLHPASVLELESPTRVLVITRVTDAQMSVINPLPGAMVYNTDQDCLHYYNGTQWINICEALDNSFTVSTRPDYFSTINPAQSKDSTVVISQTENPDGSINYNYEVGLIRGANIVNTTINGDSKIQAESITTQLLAPKSVTIGKFADAQGGAAGDIFQWNGSQWTLVNESVLGITEKDSIVGNEVVGPFDSTLTLEGDGDQDNPYTLDVAPLGIDTPELADDAVTNEKINANVAGTGLTQAVDGSLEVNVTEFDGDGTLSSTNSTISITGTPTNALFEDVQIDVADNAITNAKMFDNSVGTDELIDDSVDADKINGNIAGDGLVQNGTTGALDVDVASLTGDGDITSTGLDVTGGANSAFNDVTLEIAAGAVGSNELAADAVTTDKIATGAVGSTDIAADAVNAATINNDVAGSGLVQNGTTGALDVDVASLTGDGDITSTGLDVTGGANSAFNDVTLEIAAGAVGSNELAADAVTTDKIATGAVGSTDIAADAVNAATINNDVAGSGLVQNGTTGALDVDVASLTGDGDITSTGLDVTGGANSAFNDVTLEIAAGAVGSNELAADAVTTDKIATGAVGSTDIAADAVNAATINNDVAGSGLVQNGTTGALDVEVDETTIEIDPTNGLQIIDQGVTIDKIAPGTNGQVLTTVGGATSWENSLTSIVGTTGQVAFDSSTSTGEYTITDGAISTTSIIQLTVQENVSGNPIIIQLTNQIAGEFSVKIFEFGGAGPVLTDANWQYIVVNP